MRTDANDLVTAASKSSAHLVLPTTWFPVHENSKTCPRAAGNHAHDTDASEPCSGSCLIYVHSVVLQNVSQRSLQIHNPFQTDAVRQGTLKEVHLGLVEHEAYLRSWPPTVCHNAYFAHVFFRKDLFH